MSEALTSRARGRPRRLLIGLATAGLVAGVLPVAAGAAADTDPRVGLSAGLTDAGEAISNLEKLSSSPMAPGAVINSDLAFTGDYAIAGNFNGFTVYDVSDPAAPTVRKSFFCPGSQNDVSVFGNLLFLSVEATSAKVDCTTGGVNSTNRFRGVRIFDITDIDNPVQLPGVQTCRGSHTHTIVTDPDDDSRLWIYNSGTAGVRSAAELAGCENHPLTTDPVTSGNPTQWRIDVIEVPLAAPQTAHVVSQPRIFIDEATGAFNGLLNTMPGAMHPAGVAYSPLPNTNTCHDITAYPAVGLAAGACQGNGVLLDISDPVNPVRLDAVSDPNFSYWHSASFNNDGTKVVFTDEWGGGTQARCLDSHRPEWGANAIFDIVEGQMEFRSYYKLPAPQSTTENCVAHNGSLVPVPGRDIMIQAWYQGGTSLLDFTDSASPVEIGYFDRGPISDAGLTLGGYWSTYWYNGAIFGTEIARGFDTFDVTESEHLNAVEIAAAKQVELDETNVQHQDQITWPATFTTVRAWQSAADRQGVLSASEMANVTKFVDRAEQFTDGPQRAAAVAQLRAVSNQLGSTGVEQGLADALRDLADELG